MTSFPNRHNDEMSEYGFQHDSMSWPSDRIYSSQQSNQAGGFSPYGMAQSQPAGHRSSWMPPGPPMPEYQLSNAHLGGLVHASNASYAPNERSPRPINSPPLLYPSTPGTDHYSSSGYHSSHPLPPVHHTSTLPPRGTAHQPTVAPPPMPSIPDNLPDEVKVALRAACESIEYAAGANVPAEILMPTVQKLGKESWACRICGKEHKRRDHTLTHVRTSHLDNKGYRCTYEDCNAAFGRKGDLERHVNSTHQSMFEAQCPYCHSHLHRKDNLTRHIKTCKVANAPTSYASTSGTSRPRRSDAQAYRGSTMPYPTVRHGPLRGHGQILALRPSISSFA